MLEKLRKEIFDCSRCGFCRQWDWKGVENICPIYPFTSGFETDYARGKVRMARAVLENEIDITDNFVKSVFMCTLCKNCEKHCPIEIPLVNIFQALRADLVETGKILPAHRQLSANIEKFHNPYGRTLGSKPRSLTSSKLPKKADVLYFPGCTSVYKASGIVDATMSLLNKIGQDYTILEDACCGFPLFEVGQMSIFKKTAERTLGLIEERHPEIVVTTCPGCCKALKSVYPEKLGVSCDFKVQHITEFLLPFVKDESINFKKYVRKVAWHDPCILGRHLGIYDEPRNFLKAIPELEFIEMHPNRKDSQCCGAGGGVLSAFDKLSAKVAINTLERAKNSGAEILVTSCPACYINFKRAVIHAKMDLEVRDIVEILNRVV